MGTTDIIIFVAYALLIVVIGNLLGKKRGGSSGDYFFAGKSLSWYLVGASIIAANISAEQFIGMSGSGYAIGLAIATYEWLAALMLIVVAKYFLPVFIENKIFTMPQFLALRYDNRIKTILAIFWLMLFIFVNLSSILYLGALSLKTLFGLSMVNGIIGLAVFSLLYSLMGGLRAIAGTDIIQVTVLVVGGLLTTYLALDAIGDGNGLIYGFNELYQRVPEKFHMILNRDHEHFKYLPGWRSIFGGIWIAGIYYFGANQYIIQKAFGAKSLQEGQRGMVFAGYIKLILPFVVVLPGIAVYALGADLALPDQAYPWLLHHVVPTGARGIIFAALIAAIVSSFSAIINSTATIFTMDLYKPVMNPGATEKTTVMAGRIASVIAVILSVIVALNLGNISQAFQFIQEYTGMISPGITAIFVLGLFWKGATSQAAFWGTVLSLPVSASIKLLFGNMPFLDQMLVSFGVIVLLMVALSVFGKKDVPSKGIELRKGIFKTDRIFNLFSLIIACILSMIYLFFW